MRHPRIQKGLVDRLSQNRPSPRADPDSVVSVSLCLCGLLSLVLVAFADFTRSEWEFSKSLESTPSNDGYLRISVDGEVYRSSQRSLADLRLVDDLGKETPYSIYAQRESTTQESYEPKIFNRAILPGAYSTLTLDLEQEAESNTLVLKTSSRNFKRRVEIAGSNDRKQWLVAEVGRVHIRLQR